MILPADPGRLARARVDELMAAFREVIENGMFILGPKVDTFERAFEEWLGCKEAVGVANGTDSLELCLRALGIGQGDLVIVPTHTAVATAAAVCRSGAEPVLIDIESTSFNLDLNKANHFMSHSQAANKVKAVVPVHLYGNPCDMTDVTSFANRYGLKVIEDCSQAHGAMWQGKRVGCFGDAASFSCYPTKNLGAIGDAGVCATNSMEIADKIRMLRQYGWRERYISDDIGMNSRLDEVQAALLLVQLRHLNQDGELRKRIAEVYTRSLGNLPLVLPSTNTSALHAYHQYTVLVQDGKRDELKAHLMGHGVLAAILYPKPIHKQPAYLEVASRFESERNVSEAVCSSLICLPIHPLLSHVELDVICDALHRFPW